MSLNEIINSSAIANKSRCDLEKEYYDVFYHHKLFDKRMKSVLSHNFTDFINESAITNYLQIIQPLLVDAMKNYTCTSDLNLYCSTLNLLNELVKVHINYSSLDEDQTFFTFLNKQFEYIENEQISSDRLIKTIFSFLISLSYDKSSYSLLNYPKIINSMDNLLASDANFDINVFPALNIIVEDLFLIRTISNSEDLKELETQKEFIINLLIKWAHLPKIIYLLNIILIEYKLEGEEKVKKLSRQITDQLLHNLVKGCVNFTCIEDVNIIMKLFLSVNHVVFRPVDFVLNSIFSLFDDNLLNNQTSFLKFYSHKLILFNVLIGTSKEDIILNRLDELKTNLGHLNIQSKGNSKIEDNISYTLPVFCRVKNIDKSINQDSKDILAKYLIKLIFLALEQLDENEQMLCNDTNFKFKEFLNQLLNQLLMNIYFIVKEGLFPKLTGCLKDNFKESNDLKRINNYMKSLSIIYPNLQLQWSNILIEILGRLDDSLNAQILKIESFDDLSNRFENSLSLSSDQDKPINNQKQSPFLFKFIKNHTIKYTEQIDNHLYSPILELIRRNDYLIRFNYLVQNSNYLKNDNWLNEKNVIFFIKHSKQDSIAKIFNLISLDAELSVKFIKIMNNLKLENLIEMDQLNPILTIERLLIFCSLLHKKSTKFLIDYLLSNLYLNHNFIHLPSLRKMMLQITIKKLKCLNFIESTKDERLDKEQILNFIQILNASNNCGLTQTVKETIDCLSYYLNALDLSIETDKTSENKLPDNFDPLLNNLDDSASEIKLNHRFLNEDQVDREKIDCIKNSKFEKTYNQELKSQLNNNLDNLISDVSYPNQNWLLNALLNNPLFNKSYDLFVILNSNFSVNELLNMLENEKFRKNSRNIKFSTNALEHINEILELNLNYDNNQHSSFQLLKSSKFSLVLAIRLLVIKIFKNLLEELKIESKAKYLSYLDTEELLFEEEMENFESLNKLFIDKKNRIKLTELSNLLSIFYQHLDLISRFDQSRKKFILNNQQDVLKNEENIEKLIKLDNLDYNILLRILMLYSELVQYEIKISDNSFSYDCIIVIRSFVGSDFLMNIISTYEYNSMQFTLIQSLYSYFKKKFNLFSLDNLNTCIPKHFQNHQNPNYQYLDDKSKLIDNNNLKFKHSHYACLKMNEIMNFILKQSTELIYKDDHLLQNRKLYSDQELDNLVFITLVLARLPLINRFILVPSQVWADDNQPKMVALKTSSKEDEKVGKFNYYEADTFCSTLPSEQLFDSDTLQTFINLVNLIGFTSRMQFEEIYMSLLGVIYLNDDQTKSQSTEDLFIEEVNEKANLIVLAIKGITSIILQCNQREIGFPIKNLKNRINRLVDSQYDEQIRRKAFLNTRYGSRLLNLNRHIDQPSNLKFAGLDKDLNENHFESLILGELNYNYLNLVQFTEHFYENRYGLYSTEFMKKKFGLIKDHGELNNINESSSSSSSSTPVHHLSRSDSLITGGKEEIITFKVYKNKENISVHNKMEIDVNSCIHTLLDLYWNIIKSHIAVQEEVLKSIIKISDLFFDINQFNKNLDLFFDLFKTAWSQEDEISMQYLILGICKFYTIAHETFQNDNVKFEKCKKSIEISLKSQFFSTRINCLVGLNYILQDKLNAINKGRPNQSKDNQILLVLKDYVLKHLFDKDL